MLCQRLESPDQVTIHTPPADRRAVEMLSRSDENAIKASCLCPVCVLTGFCAQQIPHRRALMLLHSWFCRGEKVIPSLCCTSANPDVTQQWCSRANANLELKHHQWEQKFTLQHREAPPK